MCFQCSSSNIFGSSHRLANSTLQPWIAYRELYCSDPPRSPHRRQRWRLNVFNNLCLRTVRTEVRICTTKTRNKKQYKKRDITHISNRNNSISTNMHMLNRYQSDIDTNTCISAFKTEPRHISIRISIGYHTKQVTGHLSNHGWSSKTNVISLLIKLYQYTTEYTRTTISSHSKVSQIISLNTVTIGPIT